MVRLRAPQLLWCPILAFAPFAVPLWGAQELCKHALSYMRGPAMIDFKPVCGAMLQQYVTTAAELSELLLDQLEQVLQPAHL